jgi:hypothetical protein
MSRQGILVRSHITGLSEKYDFIIEKFDATKKYPTNKIIYDINMGVRLYSSISSAPKSYLDNYVYGILYRSIKVTKDIPRNNALVHSIVNWIPALDLSQFGTPVEINSDTNLDSLDKIELTDDGKIPDKDRLSQVKSDISNQLNDFINGVNNCNSVSEIGDYIDNNSDKLKVSDLAKIDLPEVKNNIKDALSKLSDNVDKCNTVDDLKNKLSDLSGLNSALGPLGTSFSSGDSSDSGIQGSPNPDYVRPTRLELFIMRAEPHLNSESDVVGDSVVFTLDNPISDFDPDFVKEIKDYYSGWDISFSEVKGKAITDMTQVGELPDLYYKVGSDYEKMDDDTHSKLGICKIEESSGTKFKFKFK